MNIKNIIERCEGVVEAEIDGEIVMMSIEDGQYYGLNVVGSRIWSLIETPQSIDFICSELEKEFKVSKEQCNNEVISFLEQMKKNNIIRYI